MGINKHYDNISAFLRVLEQDVNPSLSEYISTIEISIQNNRNERDKLLFVRIEKSRQVHSLRNNTFVRKGNSTVRIGGNELVRLYQERGVALFEDEVSNLNTLNDDIDIDLLHRYMKDTGSREKDDEQFLKNHTFLVSKDGTFYFTKSFILLFGKNPFLLLKSKCNIKISHYYGNEITYSGEPNLKEKPFSIYGSLLSQIEQAVDYFRKSVRRSPIKLEGATFKSKLLIPEWVFQEAITNAVIHRSYFEQRDIQVRFFDNRIEIESPGAYPGHITSQNIQQEQFARNPVIQDSLNKFANSPNVDIGEGVNRMFKVMASHNLYEPYYVSESHNKHSVVVVLFNLLKTRHWDTISEYLDKYGRIKSQDARRITGINDSNEMKREFDRWMTSGLIIRRGKKRGAYYIKNDDNRLGYITKIASKK